MADKSRVKINALTRLTALVILELFLFSDFSLPLSQMNPAYALVPAFKTNPLSEKTGTRNEAELIRAIIQASMSKGMTEDEVKKALGIIEKEFKPKGITIKWEKVSRDAEASRGVYRVTIGAAEVVKVFELGYDSDESIYIAGEPKEVKPTLILSGKAAAEATATEATQAPAAEALEEGKRLIRIAITYISFNLPKELDVIDREGMAPENFDSYITPESADKRPFVPIKGLLLATGKPLYVDDVSFAAERKEIVFIDEDIYANHGNLIHSGQKKIDEIDVNSIETLPANFIPEGQLNRANRIITDIEDKIIGKGKEFLDYVNTKRREIAKERGLAEEDIKDLSQDELYEIIRTVHFSCLNQFTRTASVAESKDGKHKWIIFLLEYLSALSDEEFALVYGHELGHIIVDSTIPDSEVEKKLHNITTLSMEAGGQISSVGLSEEEKEKLSNIFLNRENIADLTSVTITGGDVNILKQAILKGREISIQEDPAYAFIVSLGIRTHPDVFVRGIFVQEGVFRQFLVSQLEDMLTSIMDVTITPDVALPLLEIGTDPIIMFKPPASPSGIAPEIPTIPAAAEAPAKPATTVQAPAAEVLADRLIGGEELSPEEIALAMPVVAERLHASVSANTTLQGYAGKSRQIPEDGLAETLVIDLSTDTLKSTVDLRFSITNLPAKVKKVRIVVHDSNLPEGVELDGYLKKALGLSDEILGGRKLEVVIDREIGALNTAEAIGKVAERTGKEKDVMRIVISDVLEDTEGVKGQLRAAGDAIIVLRETEDAFFFSWLFDNGLKPSVSIFTGEISKGITSTFQSGWDAIAKAFGKSI
jgi:hypothetical protein